MSMEIHRDLWAVAGGAKNILSWGYCHLYVSYAPGNDSTAMHIWTALAKLSVLSEMGEEGGVWRGSEQENMFGGKSWRMRVRQDHI